MPGMQREPRTGSLGQGARGREPGIPDVEHENTGLTDFYLILAQFSLSTFWFYTQGYVPTVALEGPSQRLWPVPALAQMHPTNIIPLKDSISHGSYQITHV